MASVERLAIAEDRPRRRLREVPGEGCCSSPGQHRALRVGDECKTAGRVVLCCFARLLLSGQFGAVRAACAAERPGSSSVDHT